MPKLFDSVAHEALERLGGFNSCEATNMVRAIATLNCFAPTLFAAVAHEALEHKVGVNSQDVVNIVWAVATLNRLASRPRSSLQRHTKLWNAWLF